MHQAAKLVDASFAAGTLVHTRDGLKSIEDISVGDWVLSHPDDKLPPARLREQSEYFYRQVTEKFVHEDELVSELTAWDLGNDIQEVLKVTPGHPFFLKGAGWIEAGELKFGNGLLTYEYANLLVKNNTVSQERTRVYNFEVDEFHTYYVGKLGAWVHNKGKEPDSLPKFAERADGVLLTCEASTVLPMAQRYFLF